MADLNQNKKSYQTGWPESVWKLYFILEINHIQHNCLQLSTNGCSKNTCEKGAKLVSAYEKINLKILWKHSIKRTFKYMTAYFPIHFVMEAVGNY